MNSHQRNSTFWTTKFFPMAETFSATNHKEDTMFKRNPEFDQILAEAEKAASAAAKEWLDAAIKRGPAFTVHQGSLFGGAPGPTVGALLDLCGGGYIKITDGRKKFARYLLDMKKHEYEQRTGRKPSARCIGKYWSVHHELSMRQEMGLAEAALRAFFTVMKNHGVSEGMYVHTYID